MWVKTAAIFFLFYFFALLQNSFFVHFNFFGAVPNFVFILFFALTFFEAKDKMFLVVFYSVVGGFFADVFSAGLFGLSVALFLITGFLTKKIQSALAVKQNDNFPFSYFLPLFFIFFAIYTFAIKGNFVFFPQLAYNLIVASAFFWIYKKVLFR